MRFAGLIVRGSRLGFRRQYLLAEAAIKLASAAVVVRFLPFRRAIRMGSAVVDKAPEAPVEDCVWAINAAARYLPVRSVCIQKGLALQHMLRRRGYPALLHYGVGLQDDAELKAHVWVTVDGKTIIGGAEAPMFKCLAIYP